MSQPKNRFTGKKRLLYSVLGKKVFPFPSKLVNVLLKEKKREQKHLIFLFFFFSLHLISHTDMFAPFFLGLVDGTKKKTPKLQKLSTKKWRNLSFFCSLTFLLKFSVICDEKKKESLIYRQSFFCLALEQTTKSKRVEKSSAKLLCIYDCVFQTISCFFFGFFRSRLLFLFFLFNFRGYPFLRKYKKNTFRVEFETRHYKFIHLCQKKQIT